MTVKAADTLRYLGAFATIAVGAVHLQQYADFIHDVPTIGVLFLLNAAGAGAVAVLLTTRRVTLAAIGGVALSLGALISIAISMTADGLFGYTEPTFRAPVTVAVVAEVAAVLLLLAYLVVRRAPQAVRADWSTT